MHDPFGYDEKLAGFDGAGRLAFDVHHHLALQDVEEVVRILMPVKGELSLELHHHDLIVIVVGNHMRVPMAGEQSQLFGEFDRLHQRHLVLNGFGACADREELSQRSVKVRSRALSGLGLTLDDGADAKSKA